MQARRENCGCGVDLRLENERHLIADHIADHAAECGRHHAKGDGGKRCGLHAERDLGAEHAVEGDAHRIEPEENGIAALDMRYREKDENGSQNADDQRGLVHHPEDRPVENDIAQRTAADTGEGGEKREAGDVHFRTAGDERAGSREHGNGEKIGEIDRIVEHVRNRLAGGRPGNAGSRPRSRDRRCYSPRNVAVDSFWRGWPCRMRHLFGEE